MATVAEVAQPVPDSPSKAIAFDTPDHELLCYPRWLVLCPASGFYKMCSTTFSITNEDVFAVAWCVKAHDKILRISQGHGILRAGEKRELTLYVCPYDDWPRDMNEYLNRKMRIVAESLRIQDTVFPTDTKEESRLARTVFAAAAKHGPMTRLFTKMGVIFEKKADKTN